MDICLATNLLILDPATLGWWRQLRQTLAGRDVALALFTTNLAAEPPEMELFEFPYLMRDYPRLYPNLGLAGGYVDAHLLECWQNECERGGGGRSVGRGVQDVLLARQFWDGVLELLEPGVVLAWDPFHPQSRLLQRVCVEKGIAWFSMERGLLPGTLMIESRGLNGWSDLQNHWLTDRAAVAGMDENRFERLAEWYRTCRPRKYADVPRQTAEQLRAELGVENRRVVLVLGHFDACGMVPAASRVRRYHAPHFPSTESMVMAVWRELGARADLAVVFKPHPLDLQPYAVAKIEGVTVVREADPLALIELADVIVAQFTTLQFEAVFFDKPVVLLGRSPWWGYGATYEVEKPEELGVALDAALARRDWQQRRSRARRFLLWLMDRFLFACSPEVPARHGLEDLAGYIARLVPGDRSRSEVLERMQTLRTVLDELKTRSQRREQRPVVQAI